MILNLSADKVAEQREILNAVRDAKETLPVSVTTSLGTFIADADEKADLRMSNALLLWDSLNITSIDWTLSDNSILAMTKAELQSFKDGIIVARGLRSLQLHQYASGLKATLPVPDNSTIFDGDTWPL